RRWRDRQPCAQPETEGDPESCGVYRREHARRDSIYTELQPCFLTHNVDGTFIPSMASMKAAATLRRVDRIGRVSGAASRNAFSRGSEVRHRRLSVVSLVLGGQALLGMAGGAAALKGR